MAPVNAAMPSPAVSASAVTCAFCSICARVMFSKTYVPTDPPTPTAPPAPVMIIASISLSSVACTRMESSAVTTAPSSISASVKLLTTTTPAAPVTPTKPPFMDMAICSKSSCERASTAISPPEATCASSPIQARVSFSKIITSPVMPIPTKAPPPEPEKVTKSVSLVASTETDCVSLLLSVWFSRALSSIKARARE